MPDQIRVIIQLHPTRELAAAAFGAVAGAPPVRLSNFPGVELDTGYSPVPVPPSKPAAILGASGNPNMAADHPRTEAFTQVVRAAVSQDAVEEFLVRAKEDPQVVGVFADPRIEPIAVCPRGPDGTDKDIEQLLKVEKLQRRGLDGSGVRVVVVDSGINLNYLRMRGKNPVFDADLSWGPTSGQPLGNMPVGHGTMCAYDVCIAAPSCTLIDHALLTSQTRGGSAVDGLLSDALRSYGLLLSHLNKAPEPFAGDERPQTLVVNNSWAMYHHTWDFPKDHPENYSDNPEHPFNIQVAALEEAGADIMFAAGNCGPECPDWRCEGVTDAGIFGANSSPAVTCVAGVLRDKQRAGYSTKGPGHLDENKPDIACFTHFAGSGVYAADGGTSAATPVAAGVVAAVRRLYPARLVSPGELRDLLRETAESQSGNTFDHEYGYGVIDVDSLLGELEQRTAA